jgi:hypothetical protein
VENFKVCQQVGPDGILHLDIPVGIRDREVEVMIIYQPISSTPAPAMPLADLYGICVDDPISLDDGVIDDTLDGDLAGAFE